MKKTLIYLLAPVLLMFGLQACEKNDLEEGYGYYLCVGEMSNQGTLDGQTAEQIKRGLTTTAIGEKTNDNAKSEFDDVIRKQCAAFELIAKNSNDWFILKFKLLNGTTIIKLTEARFEYGKGFTYMDLDLPK